MIEAVKETVTEVKEEAPKKKSSKKSEGADDLTKIKGIGPAFVKRLAVVGIVTFDDLIALTEAKIDKMEEETGDSFTSWDKWCSWIEQAKELKG